MTTRYPKKSDESSALSGPLSIHSDVSNSPYIQFTLYFAISSHESSIIDYLEQQYFFQNDILEFCQNQNLGAVKELYWETFSFSPIEFSSNIGDMKFSDDSRIIRLFVSIKCENLPDNISHQDLSYLLAQSIQNSIIEYLTPNVESISLKPTFAFTQSDSLYSNSQINPPEIRICFPADQFDFDTNQFLNVMNSHLPQVEYKFEQKYGEFCLSYLLPQQILELTKSLNEKYPYSMYQVATSEHVSMSQLNELASKFDHYSPESDLISFAETQPIIKRKGRQLYDQARE